MVGCPASWLFLVASWPCKRLLLIMWQFSMVLNHHHILPADHANSPLHCDHVSPLFLLLELCSNFEIVPYVMFLIYWSSWLVAMLSAALQVWY
jgi:hypothetical protein